MKLTKSDKELLNISSAEDILIVATEFETKDDTDQMSRDELTDEIARLLEYIAYVKSPCEEGDLECLKHKRKNCACICEEGDTNG